MTKLKAFLLASGVALAIGATPKTAQAVEVGLELALLVDVSGSVSTSEYALQMQGYRQAFNSASVQTAISRNPTASIAVAVIQWAGATSQQLSIGFTQVTAASAGAFGDSIGALVRAFSGGTQPDDAINFTVPLFASNGFDAPRQVIDVSGDGTGNAADTRAARDAALAAGIDAINGVVIGGSASVFDFFVNNIQGGTGAFTLAADSFDDFAGVIAQKLAREIAPPPPAGVPVPMSLALFGVALAGLAAKRARGA